VTALVVTREVEIYYFATTLNTLICILDLWLRGLPIFLFGETLLDPSVIPAALVFIFEIKFLGSFQLLYPLHTEVILPRLCLSAWVMSFFPGIDYGLTVLSIVEVLVRIDMWCRYRLRAVIAMQILVSSILGLLGSSLESSCRCSRRQAHTPNHTDQLGLVLHRVGRGWYQLNRLEVKEVVTTALW
jgi:hypothetical protein